MAEHVIMDAGGMRRTLVRLAHEIAERNENLNDIVLLGIKRGGEVVADRIRERLSEAEGIVVPSFGIDIGMQRDDLVSAFFVPDYTAERPDFSIENKIAVLCDDVLNTGRSVRAALEAIFKIGRPREIQLLELIDRGGRELPIRADFVGKNVPTSRSEYVEAYFTELGAAEDRIVIGKEDAND